MNSSIGNDITDKIGDLLCSLGINNWHRSPVENYSVVPHSVDIKQYVHTQMTTDNKTLIFSCITLFNEMIEYIYKNVIQIYVYGSKVADTSAACAIYEPISKLAMSCKLHPKHTVVATEFYALYLALIFIKLSLEFIQSSYVILTDSKTAAMMIITH